MNELTFTEFPPTGYNDWKKMVQKELGEKPFTSISWENENGFDLEPLPEGNNKIVQVKIPAAWEICQEISGSNANEVNRILLSCLSGGADSLGINFRIDSEATLEKVLKDIQVEIIATHFIHPDNPVELINWIINYCNGKNINTKSFRGSIHFSSIQPGKLSFEIFRQAATRFSLFKILNIDATYVHNAGGLPVHELAYALARGNEFLYELTNAGIPIDDASALIQFNFETGSSYFVEMTKYRAMRAMWATIIRQYKPSNECSETCFIYSSTSSFLQTAKDHYNNLLRATTQAMSAIAGGADSVVVVPVHGNDGSLEQSLRLARNIQHLLIEESYLREVRNVCEGSVYIEELTVKLVEQSWKLFQDLEKKGGITKAKATLDHLIAKSLTQRQLAIRDGKKIVVGVNKYQDKGVTLQSRPNQNTLTGFLESE